jgi:hypothetical protein
VTNLSLRSFAGRDRTTLADALDRGIDGLFDGVSATQGAAAAPEHAFALHPLLDTAAMLRESLGTAPPPPPGRAEMMAMLRWTPQQRPALPVRLRAAARARWRDVTASMVATPRWFAMPAGAALATVLAVALALASGGSSAAASTLTILEGTVEVQTPAGWQALPDGAAVSAGDRVRLGPESSALLTFRDGSVLQLGEHAEIVVETATFDGARTVRIEHVAGPIEVRVPGDDRAGASFTLAAPGAVVEVEAGAFAVDVTASGAVVDGVRGRVMVERLPAPATSALSSGRDAGERDGADSDGGMEVPSTAAREREDERVAGTKDGSDGHNGVKPSSDSKPLYSPVAPAPGKKQTEPANKKSDRPSETKPSLLPPLDRKLFVPSPTPRPKATATATASGER